MIIGLNFASFLIIKANYPLYLNTIGTIVLLMHVSMGFPIIDVFRFTVGIQVEIFTRP